MSLMRPIGVMKSKHRPDGIKHLGSVIGRIASDEVAGFAIDCLKHRIISEYVDGLE